MSEDLLLKPPIHPGHMMTQLLMPQRGIDMETVASKSGIPLAALQEFAAGEGRITLQMRNRLRGVFGEAATTLYRMQQTYDYFRDHGHRPLQRSGIEGAGPVWPHN